MFADRFIDTSDLNIFSDMILRVVKISLFQSFMSYQANIYFKDVKSELSDEKNPDSCDLFANFCNEEVEHVLNQNNLSQENNQQYLPVRTQTQLKTVVKTKLTEYNDSHPVMNLELFREVS